MFININNDIVNTNQIVRIKKIYDDGNLSLRIVLTEIDGNTKENVKIDVGGAAAFSILKLTQLNMV